jgi:outer membrane protein TolC
VVAPSKSDDDLVADAMKQRFDIKAKGIAVSLAKQQLNAAWMQFVPTLDAAWQFQYQFTEPPDLGSDDRSRWAAVLTLTVPLYDHFRYGDLDYKRAALRQAEVDVEDTKSTAALEIRKARRSYLDTLSNVTIAEKQSALAGEALALVEESYAAGTGSSLEVTDARRTASSADINLAAQQLKAGLALLDLLQAIGEDFSELPEKRVASGG